MKQFDNCDYLIYHSEYRTTNSKWRIENYMYNISELSNDEIKYICERMNFKDVRYYLQMHPKEFNKIKPGFTVKR